MRPMSWSRRRCLIPVFPAAVYAPARRTDCELPVKPAPVGRLAQLIALRPWPGVAARFRLPAIPGSKKLCCAIAKTPPGKYGSVPCTGG